MNVNVLEAAVEFLPQKFKTPLILSSGTIEALPEARVVVRVRVDGREESGCGSIYLSDLWAWPDPTISHETRQARLVALTTWIAAELPSLVGGEAAHPTELGLRLHHSICHSDDTRVEGIPSLARSMCLSPFDAAIHDAAGQAINQSAFRFYDDSPAIPSADAMFPKGGASSAIARMLVRPPRRELPAWVIVGKNDDLERDLKPWAIDRGYRCFKLKVMGKDNSQDVARTAEVYRATLRWGVRQPWLSIDSNEANPDAASVRDFLERLRAADAAAYEALRYLEQPTGRDIRLHRYDWREVTRLKPVMLDEGLTDLALLDEALEKGWSGLALKTCKGHSFAIVAAAWAHERGMTLTVQDLTNPGISLIHAALFAARLPTINGVELNSPQFTPDANRDWLPRLEKLFEPADGVHRLPEGMPIGLGTTL